MHNEYNIGSDLTKSERKKFVEESLSKYKIMTKSVIDKYMFQKEPKKHLYDILPSYPNRRGKGFRPSLCIATCKAHGGNAYRAVLSAASIELFHNAFLIHDDIEDESEYRRGDLTLHTKFGTGIAINVGDAMNVMSTKPLMQNLTILGPYLTWAIFTEIEHMAKQSVEGQAIELGWVQDNVCDLSEEDYLRMTLKKTCWYTCIHPIRIGALIGSKLPINLDRFNLFGYYMGAAFQIQDDILNLVGDYEKYGKEIGGDIWEGKRTLILIHLLNSCTIEERKNLKKFLKKPRKKRTYEEVKNVYHLISRYGSIENSRSKARQLAGAALYEFNNAFKDLHNSEEKQFIQEIILYMIERDL